MKKYTIVTTCKLSDSNKDSIAAINPMIEIIDAFHLHNAEQEGDFSRKAEFDAILAGADIVYALLPPVNLINRAPKLKWIQTALAGVDQEVYDDIFHSAVVVTNSSGIHGVQITELVFTMMLMFVKRSPFSLKMQEQKRWERFIPALMSGKTIGIIGLGNIGKEIARVAKAHRMTVLATRRSIRKETRARNVDRLLPSAQMGSLLKESDFVVLAVPSITETFSLIGRQELQMMKASAYLINIARGSVIDEPALIEALRNGTIAGAGLDTVTSEPLPPDSPLWELPNVIITPHLGGRLENYYDVATDIFCENLRRYLEGRHLIKIVNKKRGY